jgi:hypothetical protein
MWCFYFLSTFTLMMFEIVDDFKITTHTWYTDLPNPFRLNLWQFVNFFPVICFLRHYSTKYIWGLAAIRPEMLLNRENWFNTNLWPHLRYHNRYTESHSFKWKLNLFYQKVLMILSYFLSSLKKNYFSCNQCCCSFQNQYKVQSVTE